MMSSNANNNNNEYEIGSGSSMKKKKKKKMGSSIRALVVDDDSVNRMIHSKMLEKLGIDNLEVATNGEEAVELVRSSGLDYFQLILMDMDMPVMNGIQATKKLRAMGTGSMITGVSSRSMEGEIREFVEAGLDDYQQKPLTTPKLISVLQKLNHPS